VGAAPSIDPPPPVHVPDPADLELEVVDLPRDAFFGAAESVPAEEAVGRIAAEQVTPYPPGIPVIVPGERIDENVIDYLKSGVEAGMVLPDPADPSVKTIRVARRPG
jgi:arginine decarboxylase